MSRPISSRTWSVPHDFNSDVIEAVAHRPWPLPAGPWMGTQTWTDLLFLHWPIDARQLETRIPPAFELDLHEGQAWVGVVPFQMSNVSLRGVPAMPWASAFPEVNVRTYVRAGGKPGVFFFSLDAASALAVRTARRLLNLPYFLSDMSLTTSDATVRFASERRQQDATLIATYEPIGERFRATPGTLEYFLTERYCLYHVSRSREPYRLDIHHPAWSLQRATADVMRHTLLEAAGLSVDERRPSTLFAKRQDTVAWLPTSALETRSQG